MTSTTPASSGSQYFLGGASATVALSPSKDDYEESEYKGYETDRKENQGDQTSGGHTSVPNQGYQPDEDGDGRCTPEGDHTHLQQEDDEQDD